MAKRTRAATARRKSARPPAKASRPRPRLAKARGAAPTRKGGPVPGTPSPMRTRMTPALQAHVKRLYETTDQPVCQIALDVGVNESVIRRMAPREGWVRFVAPPRDLPPVTTLMAELERLEASLSGDGEATPDPSPPHVDAARAATQHIERFIAVVMAHLDEFEMLRRNGKLLPKHHLTTARAISILTEAFNRLQRLRAAQPGSTYDDLAAAGMPADLDAFRERLACRIDAFIASRANDRAAGSTDAG